MNASDFLYKKYGIAVTEHNKLPVAIKPIDLLKYMEEYAALRQPPVSGRSEQLPCEHRSYRAGHSPFVPCICNDCGEEL